MDHFIAICPTVMDRVDVLKPFLDAEDGNVYGDFGQFVDLCFGNGGYDLRENTPEDFFSAGTPDTTLEIASDVADVTRAACGDIVADAEKQDVHHLEQKKVPAPDIDLFKYNGNGDYFFDDDGDGYESPFKNMPESLDLLLPLSGSKIPQAMATNTAVKLDMVDISPYDYSSSVPTTPTSTATGFKMIDVDDDATNGDKSETDDVQLSAMPTTPTTPAKLAPATPGKSPKSRGKGKKKTTATKPTMNGSPIRKEVRRALRQDEVTFNPRRKPFGFDRMLSSLVYTPALDPRSDFGSRLPRLPSMNAPYPYYYSTP